MDVIHIERQVNRNIFQPGTNEACHHKTLTLTKGVCVCVTVCVCVCLCGGVDVCVKHDSELMRHLFSVDLSKIITKKKKNRKLHKMYISLCKREFAGLIIGLVGELVD